MTKIFNLKLDGKLDKKLRIEAIEKETTKQKLIISIIQKHFKED